MNEVRLTFFGCVISIVSNSKFVIQRIAYIFRYFLTDEENIDLYFKINLISTDANLELVNSQDKFNIEYSYDNNKFFKWNYLDTFMPPLQIEPLCNKYIVLHGCAARVKDQTVCFFAPSMAGKTSILLMLLEYGYKAISDDLLFWNLQTKELKVYKKPVGIRESMINIMPDLFKKIQEIVKRKDVPCFYNNYNKRTWLMHLDDIYNEEIYYKKDSTINYIFIPTIHGEKFEKVSALKSFELCLNSICNSGVNRERIRKGCIDIIESTKGIYILPTNDLKKSYEYLMSVINEEHIG